MSGRDELEELFKAYGVGHVDSRVLADAMVQIGYRKPRAVTTVEELEGLPNHSVILDGDGDVWQKRNVEWCSYETARQASKRLTKYAPLTVLFEGEG